MEATPKQDEIPGAMRLEQVARMIAEIRAAGLANEPVDDEAILANRPDLLPELRNELEKLRRVEAARRAAQIPPSDPEPVDAAAAETLAAMLERPSIQVPGYSVLREINRGGQAVVYLAHQLSTGRKVAIKVMRDGPLADDRALARFHREVQILAALNHPNIVAIIDTGRTAEGSHYIVMNYIAGCGLAEYMQRRQAKDLDDPSKLLRLFLRLCGAVNAAHRQGIVHRDLKPGNIRVDERGEPQVLDFGLARTTWARVIGRNKEPVSITGEFLGSLPWSSPEQAEGDPEKIDARTDVYSLGVILYQMLTGGRFPYVVVGNIRDVLNNILTVEPTPPSKAIAAELARRTQQARRIATEHSAAVNESIERVVLKALSKQREQRYRSAGEFGRDIASYLAGGKTTAAPDSREPVKPAQMRFIKASLCVGGVLIVATATLVAYWIHHSNLQGAARGGSASSPQSAQVNLSPSSTASGLVPTEKPRRVDLMKMIDVSRDAVGGPWQLRAGELHCGEGAACRFRLPYTPPEEYDFLIEFTVLEGAPRVWQLCSTKDATFAWNMGLGSGTAAFHAVKGCAPNDPNNPARAEGTNIPELGGRHQSIVKVRRDGVSGWVDGKQLVAYPTDFRDLSLNGHTAVGIDTLGVGDGGHVTFHRIEVVEITGQGRQSLTLKPAAAPLQIPANARRSSLIGVAPRISQSWSGRDPGYRNMEGREVVVNGEHSDNYLYAYCPTSLMYDIPVGAIAFSAIGARPRGAVRGWRYFVYVDGDLAYASPDVAVVGGNVPIQVALPAGAHRMELRTCETNGNADCFGAWADPEFILSSVAR